VISVPHHEGTNFHFSPAHSRDDAWLVRVQKTCHLLDDYDHHDSSAAAEIAARDPISGDDAWYE
jgi:hypothetical protein